MSKLVISSASFYFWMKKFCPIEAISLTHKNLVNKFNGIDIYIELILALTEVQEMYLI